MSADTTKDCGLCPRILDIHCRLHGQDNPTFCDLLNRYKSDPAYGADDVLYDLQKIATPDQVAQVRAEYRRLEKVGQVPPTA